MQLFGKGTIQISPSLICLDVLHVLGQVKELENAGIKMLHIDILDGRFSPSMPLGFDLVRQLRAVTNMAFECHVMAENPEYYIQELLDMGVEQIVFHLETASHADGLINKIHNMGTRAGIALKPSTPISSLEYIIEKCDTVLLMLINPGYASSSHEAQVPYAKRKIEDLKKMIERLHPETLIEVDGRISLSNVKEFTPLGVNIFVGGTTCIDRNHIADSIRQVNDTLACITAQ